MNGRAPKSQGSLGMDRRSALAFLQVTFRALPKSQIKARVLTDLVYAIRGTARQ